MGLVSIAFLPSKKRVVVTGRGDLVASDIMDAAARVYGDPQFQCGMSTLLDVRGARPAVTADKVRTIVGFVSHNLERRGKGRCAVVTGREVDYGMARMAHVYMEAIGIKLMVFTDLEAAERWLDWEGESEAHASTVEANEDPEFGGV